MSFLDKVQEQKIKAHKRFRQDWQVPDVCTRLGIEGVGRPALCFKEGRPDAFILEIVKRYGFKYCPASQRWWIPENAPQLKGKKQLGKVAFYEHPKACAQEIMEAVADAEREGYP